MVRSLRNLDYEPDRHGPLLIPIITSKIPEDLILIISRKFDSADSCDIEMILNALKTEIIAPEKDVLVSKQGENVRDEYFREPVKGSTLFSHQGKSPISCLFCKKPQKSQNWRIVSDTGTRKKFANKYTLFCAFKRFSSRKRLFFKEIVLQRDCSSKRLFFKNVSIAVNDITLV